ncbi:MAG: M6 family metalloprotease domain-containing protein, partial [Candidatus Neomarinimicrobiota bacterium]
MKAFKGIVALLTFAIVAGNFALGTIPPHPRVRQLIAEGRIALPYYLEHFDEIRRRGVGSSWTAPALTRQLSLEPSAAVRSLGPARIPTGSFKVLLILVDFSDNEQEVAAAYFDTLIFQQAAGSLWDYYQAVSYGDLDIITVNLPSTVGWTRAPQTYAYYVNGQNGFGTYPQNAQRLVEDVVTAVDSLVDFSQYDNDADGYVDALFIAHAGPGAEYTGSDYDIWSHAWVTYNPPVLDGVTIYHYSMEPEYWAAPGDMTIGVFAHEMGHAVFGLPDLYDRDEVAPSQGLGRWSLMAGGSWNGTDGDRPAFPDAWSHFQMGYVSPTNVDINIVGQNIAHIESNAEAYRLWHNGSIGPEYFLIENRQKVGYDEFLPGSGLLIYHVDEAVTTQNDEEWYPGWTSYGHYLVALEQADGLWDLERKMNRGDAGDPYPGTTYNATFDAVSTPDSRDYFGGQTYVAVQNISPSEYSMTADLQVTGVPNILVSTDMLDYERVFVGTLTAESLTVFNRGADSLIVSAISTDNTAFAPDTTAFVLYADESQEVTVTFAPTTPAVYIGTL